MNILKRTLWFVFMFLMLLSWANICFGNDDSVRTLQFESNYYYYDYNEVGDSGEWLDSEKGWLTGANIMYKSQDIYSKQYWQIIYRHTKDDTHYDGFYLYTGEPCQSTTHDNFMTAEFTYAVPVNEDQNIFIFGGYGYHNWERTLSKYQKETYSWSYIPIGFRWEFSIHERLEIAINTTIKIMMNGKMKTEDFNVDLGNEPGYRIDLPVVYHFNSQWAFTATPWYEYSSIGKSNIVICDEDDESITYAWEPDSTTKQYGISLGVQWNF